MPNFFNPLHQPVPPTFQSQHSALSDACPTLSPPFQTNLPHPSFVRLPQSPPQKITAAQPRALPAAPISFELIGAPSRGTGVPMRELVVRSGCVLERMLVGAAEHVGATMGKALRVVRIRLVIPWPGYEHVEWISSIELFTSTGPLTRGQLAVDIANAYHSFIMKSSTYPPSPLAYDWRTSTGGISFDKLILLACWNLQDDVWMAEVFVDCR
ncbi:hypothetical protein EDD16DRAFT_1703830 [Pisolithus croceorrhizus]|nr:hypothetical protein EV401DRAFT_127473 [Pisolithus croceorrhizus]KAI6124161.1 hypothetical protein EDD16DRAFT_1703830 [Pisolithus croceorrhizus]KAI6159948.1 hypothetical protein EDD17DRAFT_1485646 [Pisolithus thermaeus]